MILVLEHGNSFYSHRCSKCGCKFIYQNENIEHLIEDNRLVYKIKCPECYNKEKAEKKIYNFNNNERITI